MYIYGGDLVGKLKQIWKRTKLYLREEQVPPLPGDAVLRRLLDVAYHASLLTEEGRRPSFRIVYCPRSELPEAGAGASTSASRLRSSVQIHFNTPCPFNEKQLLQLAPATDPTSVMIAVEPVLLDSADGSPAVPSPDGDLRIWGLLDTGSSWWAHMRRETERAVHSPPDMLTISSARPGQIVVSRAWRILLRLENGRLELPPADVFVNGPVARDFEGPVGELYGQVYGDRKTDDPYEPLLNRHNCTVKYTTSIKRLLTYFMDKSHGGMLLMVPDDCDVTDGAGFGELVGVKYQCRQYDLWRNLSSTLELRRRWFEAGSELARGSEKCDKDKVLELSQLRSAVEEQEHQLTDRLQLVAALSGVDGAVVMTDRFRLVGFGAELRAKARVATVWRALDSIGDQREPVRAETFGTRHRSAFRFCAEYERGTAFVHSQDGGMRAVKKVGGEVVYWEVSPPND